MAPSLGSTSTTLGLSENKKEKQMRKFLALLILMGSLAASGMAQGNYSKVDIFGGFDYSRLSTAITPVASASGFDSSVRYNFTKVVGVEGDISGVFQTVSGSFIGVSGNYPGHYYSFMGGPVVLISSKSRVKPFVHFLVGDTRVSSSAKAGSVTVSASSSGLTAMVGGGVDIRVNKHLSIRAAQVDWVYERYGLTDTSAAGNFRIVTGLVLNLGNKNGR